MGLSIGTHIRAIITLIDLTNTENVAGTNGILGAHSTVNIEFLKKNNIVEL